MSIKVYKVQHTETSPLAELLAIRDLDERDVVLAAESDDELLVGLLLACLVQDAHVGLSTVEGLACLAQTAGETVVDEGDLEDSLEGIEDGHAAALGGVGGDFDLIGRDDFLGGLFSVRLWEMLLVTMFFTEAHGLVTCAQCRSGLVQPIEGVCRIGFSSQAHGFHGITTHHFEC